MITNIKNALKAILIFLLKLALILGVFCGIILTVGWFLLPEWLKTYSLAEDLERAGKIEEAIAIYKQEAEKGDSYAATNVCRLYVSHKNIIEAEMWLKQVAEKGDGEAALMLSALYLADKDIDGKPNPLKNIAEAEKWLSSIPRGGSINNSMVSSFADYGLGMLYLTGTPTFYYDILDKLKKYGLDNLDFLSTYVEKDINKASKYFMYAYPYSSSADYELGMLFYNGTGVKKDITIAKKMFKDSIHWGYTLALEMIGKNKIKEAEEMLRKIEESEQKAPPTKSTENQ